MLVCELFGEEEIILPNQNWRRRRPKMNTDRVDKMLEGMYRKVNPTQVIVHKPRELSHALRQIGDTIERHRRIVMICRRRLSYQLNTCPDLERREDWQERLKERLPDFPFDRPTWSLIDLVRAHLQFGTIAYRTSAQYLSGANDLFWGSS